MSYTEDQIMSAVQVVLDGADGGPGLSVYQGTHETIRGMIDMGDGGNAWSELNQLLVDKHEFLNDVIFQLRVGV